MKYSLHIILLLTVVLFFSACHQNKKEISEEEVRKTKESLVNVNKILVKKDAEKIHAYVKRRGWDMEETNTGLWYMIYDHGKGEKAETGLVATINYNISLLDGTECYNSEVDGPKKFKIGQGGVEAGLEQGILLMHVGDKARFIMPPHLAYGLIGDSEKIPARAIIVYEVELTKLDKS